MTRLASEADFRRFHGREAPGIWLGMIDGDRAFGSVVWDDKGRAWGFVDVRGPVSAVTLHRGAKRLLAALAQAGEREVRVFCDTTTPGAERWLRRLGFAPAETHEGREVWLWRV